MSPQDEPGALAEVLECPLPYRMLFSILAYKLLPGGGSYFVNRSCGCNMGSSLNSGGLYEWNHPVSLKR